MKNKVTIPAEAVQDAVAAICAQKRTGQLRLNFSQGAPAGRRGVARIGNSRPAAARLGT